MTFCINTDCEFQNSAFFRGCGSPQTLNVLLCEAYKAAEVQYAPETDREKLTDFLKQNKESDPNGIEQHAPGAKLDDGKLLAGLLQQWSRALTEVLKVSTFGAHKYTHGGWQHVDNGIERYTDAMFRHLLKENLEPMDLDSGLMHEAHTAWNALSRLELILRDKESH